MNASIVTFTALPKFDPLLLFNVTGTRNITSNTWNPSEQCNNIAERNCWGNYFQRPFVLQNLNSRLNCCRLVQNILCSRILSHNTKIKIHRNLIFVFCFVWVRNWVLHIRKNPRLRAFKNRVLRKIFVPNRDEETCVWRKLHKEEFIFIFSSNFMQATTWKERGRRALRRRRRSRWRIRSIK